MSDVTTPCSDPRGENRNEPLSEEDKPMTTETDTAMTGSGVADTTTTNASDEETTTSKSDDDEQEQDSDEQDGDDSNDEQDNEQDDDANSNAEQDDDAETVTEPTSETEGDGSDDPTFEFHLNPLPEDLPKEIPWDPNYVEAEPVEYKGPVNSLVDLWRNFPTKTWSPFHISAHRTTTMRVIRENPDFPWCAEGLSMNPNLELSFVIETMKREKDRYNQIPGKYLYHPRYLSANPAFTKWDIERNQALVSDHPHRVQWCWNGISERADVAEWLEQYPRYVNWKIVAANPHLTLDQIRHYMTDPLWREREEFEYIYDPQTQRGLYDPPLLDQRRIDLQFVGRNPNLTWEFILEHHTRMNYEDISRHPAVTMEIYDANPDFPWHAPSIALNPNFTYADMQYYPGFARKWRYFVNKPEMDLEDYCVNWESKHQAIATAAYRKSVEKFGQRIEGIDPDDELMASLSKELPEDFLITNNECIASTDMMHRIHNPNVRPAFLEWLNKYGTYKPSSKLWKLASKSNHYSFQYIADNAHRNWDFVSLCATEFLGNDPNSVSGRPLGMAIRDWKPVVVQ